MEQEFKKSETSFEKEHREILEKYGAELPSPSPTLSISLVAILHEELSNNSFWRLIESVANQVDIDSNQFEVLLVVNNTKNSARSRDKSFKENQAVLQIISAIRERQNLNTPLTTLLEKYKIVGLTDHELATMQKAINSHAMLLGIDASSIDKALLKNDNNNPRGTARNIGGHLAYERLGTKPSSVIDFIDGDCFLSENYFSDLVETAATNPNMTIVKPVISVNPDLPKEIENSQLSAEQKLLSVIRYLKSSLYYTRIRFLKHPAISGQQLAVPPKTFEETNGYVTNQHQEDWEFATKVDLVNSISKAPILNNGNVYLSDRRRVGAVDGFSENKAKPVNIEELISSSEPDKIMSQLLERNKKREGNSKYRQVRQKIFDENQETRKRFLSEANTILNSAIKIYSETVEKMGFLQRKISGKKNFSEALYPQLSPEQADFFEANPILIDCLIGVIEMSKDYKKLLSIGITPTEDIFENCTRLLTRLLPEYFDQPPESEPDYQQTAHNQNLADFIHLAQATFIFR